MHSLIKLVQQKFLTVETFESYKNRSEETKMWTILPFLEYTVKRNFYDSLTQLTLMFKTFLTIGTAVASHLSNTHMQKRSILMKSLMNLQKV